MLLLLKMFLEKVNISLVLMWIGEQLKELLERQEEDGVVIVVVTLHGSINRLL